MRLFLIVCLLLIHTLYAVEEKYMSDGPMLTGSKPLTPDVSKAQRFYLHGDVRYRLQYIDRDADDSDFLHRLRVRLGVDAKVNEKMYAEIQLASGSGDPVSTNQSLGDGFSSKDIRLDIGDIYYKGDGGWLRAGKFKNPFQSAMKNQLIWDSDLRPEGVSGRYDFSADSAIIAGLWIGSHETSSDAYFYNVQAIKQFRAGGFKLSLSAAYYAVPNLKDNVTTELAGRDRANGNSVVDINGTSYYKYNYEMADLYAVAAYADFSLSYEAVVNRALSRGNFGYNIGALYANKARLNLKLGYFYRLTEADAVIGAFHDSDFMGGFTNSFGHQAMAGLDLMEKTQLALTYIDGKIRNNYQGGDEHYQRLHIDVMVTFD